MEALFNKEDSDEERTLHNDPCVSLGTTTDRQDLPSVSTQPVYLD
jgi:hypothetical protein